MTTLFILIITISAMVGDTDKVEFTGPEKYYSLQECQEEGIKLSNWLLQQDLDVRYYCLDVTGEAKGGTDNG